LARGTCVKVETNEYPFIYIYQRREKAATTKLKGRSGGMPMICQISSLKIKFKSAGFSQN
jgi:hypothetical protein